MKNTLLQRIENINLSNVEIGMLNYNGISDLETLNCVIEGIYTRVINDVVIKKASKVIRVEKTEHGVNVYSRPCKARLFGFKCSDNCDIASIIAKRLGGLFPNYTTATTKQGGYTQHREGRQPIKAIFKNLTMVSPALLIHEGFNGEYNKCKTKSKVMKNYRGLD